MTGPDPLTSRVGVKTAYGGRNTKRAKARLKEGDKSSTTESKAPRTCAILLHLHVYLLSVHFYAVANECRCFNHVVILYDSLLAQNLPR